MATSTFYKNISIDDKAADVLISLLNKPAPPRRDMSGIYRMATKEDDECFWQKHLEKLSKQNTKNL